jgi:hypothetical protein
VQPSYNTRLVARSQVSQREADHWCRAHEDRITCCSSLVSPDSKSPWNSTWFLLSMIPPLRMSTYLGVSLVDLSSFLSIIKHATNAYKLQVPLLQQQQL